jgi:hypothetical protein
MDPADNLARTDLTPRERTAIIKASRKPIRFWPSSVHAYNPPKTGPGHLNNPRDGFRRVLVSNGRGGYDVARDVPVAAKHIDGRTTEAAPYRQTVVIQTRASAIAYAALASEG